MHESLGPLDIQDIFGYLPHRYPFLLVDRIVEYVPDEKIVGLKNVTINEPYFQGHFPGVPIMPGVLLIEAMAQVGGVLVFQTLKDREQKLVFLMGVDNAKFRRPVRPGDQIVIKMVVVKVKARVGKLRGQAYVDDQLCCEADILFSLVDKQDYKMPSQES